jgi:ribosomal protein L7/L12
VWRAQVESAPTTIKKGLKKEEADALMAKLVESGGKVQLL